VVVSKASELKRAAVCRLRDGRTIEARLVGVHEPYDLALLKIDAVGLTPVDWANKTATVGTWVAAAGLEDVPVAVGVVSVAARKVTARDLPVAVNSSGGYLGIDLAADALEAGVRVTKVTPESPAASAGLKAEDVILSLAGQPTQDTESLQNAIGQHKPGEVVEIRVRRDGQEMDLKATLGRRRGGRG